MEYDQRLYEMAYGDGSDEDDDSDVIRDCPCEGRTRVSERPETCQWCGRAFA